MSRQRRNLVLHLSLASLLMAAASAGAQAAAGNEGTRVGVTGAVNPATTGTPPNTSPRLLAVGTDVVFREKITTTAAGQAQILFLDQSALMIGPNSEVTLDEFVYDPDSNKGSLVATLSQGAFRFIGGKLSKQGNATLRTPVATIGIRGSDVTVVFDAARQAADVLATHGFASIQTESGKVDLVTGFMATIAASGIGAPTRMTQDALTRSNQAFEGRPGQNGGASQPPTDQQVAESGLSETVEVAGLQSIEPASGGSSGLSGNVPSIPDPADPQNNNAPPLVPATIIKTVEDMSGRYKLTTGGGTGNLGTVRDGMGTAFDAPAFDPNNTGTLSGGTLDRFSDGSVLGIATDDGNDTPVALIAAPDGAGGYEAILVDADSAYATNLGTLSGQSTDRVYIAPDSRFFAATLSTLDITSGGFTGDRLFVFGGTPVAATELVTPAAQAVLRSFTLKPDFLLDSNIPFVRREAGGALPDPVVSPLYMIAPITGSGTGSGQALQASIAFDGEGTVQRSAAVLFIADVFNATAHAGSVAVGGRISGTANLLDDQAPPGAGTDIIRIGSAAASSPDGDGRSFFGTTTADHFVIDENGFSSTLPGGNYENAAASEGRFYNTDDDVRYGFNHVAVRDPGTTTLDPARRTARTLAGYVGGFGEARAGASSARELGAPEFSGPYVITSAKDTSGRLGVSIRTNPLTNRISAAFDILGGEENFSLAFGDTSMSTAGASSAFIDDDRFAATQRVTEETVMLNGMPESASATVGGNPAASITYLMSSGVVEGFQASLPDPAGGYCACEYTKWGFWGGEVRLPDGRRDRIHLATWVAGVLPEIGAQAPAGTATFGGHVIGTAQVGSAAYTATGNFTNQYDFGNRTGAFSMTFDGKSAGGTVNAGADWRHYGGAVGGAGIAGTVNGSFYGQAAPGAQPLETGGNFTLSGADYSASGVFAGKR